MLDVMDIVLFAFLVATAWGVARVRDLFAASMLLSLFSLLTAGLFMVMDAVDVAFTEASVGAGISTVLFLSTLSVTRRQEARRRSDPRRRRAAMVLVLLVGALLVWGTLDMPAFGDPEAPVHVYMAPRFVEESPKEIGIPNMVTAVLASYRGYDTFGETTVVFTAAIGVLLLLSRRRDEDVGDEKTEPEDREEDSGTEGGGEA